MTFAIIGASGRLGRLATAAFRAASPTTPLRLLSRRPANLAPMLGPHTECGFADLADPAALAQAFRGITTLLLISTDGDAPTRTRRHRAAIEHAASSGVTHIVYTSMVGARADSPLSFARGHADTETVLKASGISHTILRNAPYAEVLDTFVAAAMGDDQLIMPAARARVAYVPRANAAAAATGAMLQTANGSATNDITGSHAFNGDDIARLIGEVRGVTPVVIDADAWEYLQATIVPFGAPRYLLQAAEAGWALGESGEYAAVSPDIRDVARTSLISLPDYVRSVIVPKADL